MITISDKVFSVCVAVHIDCNWLIKFYEMLFSQLLTYLAMSMHGKNNWYVITIVLTHQMYVYNKHNGCNEYNAAVISNTFS